MLRDYLIAIAAGVASALIYAVAGANMFLAMLIVPFAPVPLFFVGLSRGYRMVFLAGGVAAVLGGLVLGSFAFSLIYALGILGPVALIVRNALLNRTDPQGNIEWYPTGRLLVIGTIYFSLLFLIAAGLFAGHEGGLVGLFSEQVRAIYGETLGAVPAPDGQSAEAALQATAYNAVTWTPGMGVLFMAISMLLAQLVLRRFSKTLRPSFEFTEMVLPRWPAYVFAAALSLGLFAPDQIGFVGAGVAIAFGAPYFFLGITVVHNFARRLSAGIIVLIALYALLLFAQPFSMMALAGLGLAEQWFNMRRRFGGGGSGPGGPGQDLTRQE